MIRPPDLLARPFNLVVERSVPFPPATIYRAWTEELDRWFATPGSVLMTAREDAPYFFETENRTDGSHPAVRHPHYGRFLRLEQDRLVELTWVTGAGGTRGAETVVTLELMPEGAGSWLRLTHAGFPDYEPRDRHAQAWPMVLDQMERALGG